MSYLAVTGFIALPLNLNPPINITAHLLFLFCLVNLLVLIYFLKKKSRALYQIRLQIQDLQEKINILTDENAKIDLYRVGLQEKINRYQSLKKIIEEINQSLNLESVTEALVEIAFSLVARHKGNCILYLADSQKIGSPLSLFKAKKEDKKLVLKAKEGDIFDFWVLRHSRPLIIEDIRRDFRFDLEKLNREEKRPIGSLISAPLKVEQKFLGILRLDNPQVDFYTQDDLRFLVTLSDLGAVALENSQLFQKQKDLAIHDELTTLYTKGHFLSLLKEECKRSLRQKKDLSLLMLDIDYFKNYNDKFGHTAGDMVLRVLSQSTTEFFKDQNCLISRFGGEEFCILLLEVDKIKAQILAEALRQEIAKLKIILRRQPTNITVSIGVAGFPADAQDEDELIIKSDRAMYEAKGGGRNRVVCFK